MNEKMTMELARKSLLGKARERPDQVRRVLEKVGNEGLLPTVAAVRASAAGVVLALGHGVQAFKPGDRAHAVRCSVGGATGAEVR